MTSAMRMRQSRRARRFSREKRERHKGNRVLGGSEDTAQVCLIPISFETLGFDADFGRLFLLQQVQRNMPQNGKVLVTGSFAEAALVFPKRDVERPVEFILDAPL